MLSGVAKIRKKIENQGTNDELKKGRLHFIIANVEHFIFH